MGFLPDDQNPEIAAQKEQGQGLASREMSISEMLKRQPGLIAREAITPSTVGMVGGAIAGAPFEVSAPAARVGASGAFLADIGAKVYNSLVAKGDEKRKVPELSAVLEDIKNQIGLPKPETPLERIESRVVGAAADIVPMITGGQILAQAKNAPKIIQKAGEFISASPRVQSAAAITGGAIGGASREMGGNEIGNTLAELAGNMAVPTVARMVNVMQTASRFGIAKPAAFLSGLFGGASESTKKLAINLFKAGKNPEDIAKNIALYEIAGTTPTLAQAVENPIVQGLETTAGRFPSGMATMREKGLTQQAEIGRKVEELRSQMSNIKEPVEAGRAVQKGFSEVFVPRARQIQKNLYNAFDANMPERTLISSDETEKALLGLINKMDNAAPSLQKEVLNEKLSGYLNGIYDTKQLNPEGKIPFNVLKVLRTAVGEELGKVDLTPKVTKSQYKEVWKGITKDLELAAARQGPETLSKWKAANTFTKNFHDTMENVQSLIMDKDPEDVYQAIISGARNGPTRLQEIFNVVPKDAQKAVSSAFIERMGKAAPGMQDPTGDIFSTAKYLQNYATLDPQSRKILLGGFGKQFEDDMKAIAEVSNKIREGTSIVANPSGTAGAVVLPATISSLAGSAGAGKFGFASGIIATLIGANQAAKLFTNPQFVHWLANNRNTPIRGTAASLGTLYRIYEKTGNEDIKEVHDTLRNNAIKQEIIRK